MQSEEGPIRSLMSPATGLLRGALKRRIPDSVLHRMGRGAGQNPRGAFAGHYYPKDFYGDGAEAALIANMTNSLMPYWLRSGDKAVMGVPVEARCPLLDYRVVELAFRLPVGYLIRDGWRKWILRKAMEDFLPEQVVWRKQKMGFPFPYERFLNESRTIIDAIFAQATNPFLDLSRKAVLQRDWKAMSFILWYELYFNENLALFEEIERVARQGLPLSDYKYTPAFLKMSQPA